MKGTVSKIKLNGFLEVKTESVTSIVEVVGCSVVNVGDELEGGLDSVGGKEITNLTQNEPVDAFVQEVV